MTTYYPDWVGTPREAISLRHVLHMESGLDWNEDYAPDSLATSDIIDMVAFQGDQQAFAASRPAAVAPGTRFNYSSGDSMLLSGVIEQATGMKVEDYARTKLLDPIGIETLDWWEDAEGHNLTYCCVDSTSRDFARFGLLYLEGGLWGSDQVVPASWVSDSIADTSATFDGYGYQWWLDLDAGGPLPPYFSAIGVDGQYIYVVPDLDLVVVRNGRYTKSECPSVADPNLFTYYPSQGLVPGQGTVGPDSWSTVEFLTPIVEAVTRAPAPDAEDTGAHPASVPEPPSDASAAHTEAEDCANVTGPTAATPVSATPAFTG